MTKKELVKIIQEVVRREIKKEVNKIFIKEQKTSQKLTDVIPKVSKPREKVKYTKNKSLNDVYFVSKKYQTFRVCRTTLLLRTICIVS